MKWTILVAVLLVGVCLGWLVGRGDGSRGAVPVSAPQATSAPADDLATGTADALRTWKMP